MNKLRTTFFAAVTLGGLALSAGAGLTQEETPTPVAAEGAATEVAHAPQELPPLQVGQEGAADQVGRYLRALGHREVARMNLDVPNADSKAYILTANADNSEWYLVSGDGPLGQSTRFTIYSAGVDLQINDYRAGNLDTSGLDFNAARNEADCETLSDRLNARISCGFFDEIVEDYQDRLGQDIAALGTTRNGQTITFFANDSGTEFTMTRTWPGGGATLVSGFGEDFTFSDRILQSFEPPAVASLQTSQPRRLQN